MKVGTDCRPWEMTTRAQGGGGGVLIAIQELINEYE